MSIGWLKQSKALNKACNTNVQREGWYVGCMWGSIQQLRQCWWELSFSISVHAFSTVLAWSSVPTWWSLSHPRFCFLHSEMPYHTMLSRGQESKHLSQKPSRCLLGSHWFSLSYVYSLDQSLWLHWRWGCTDLLDSGRSILKGEHLSVLSTNNGWNWERQFLKEIWYNLIFTLNRSAIQWFHFLKNETIGFDHFSTLLLFLSELLFSLP